ncbi:hypothetical protein Rhein_3439 [Rheinheimera sp. A13L]|uniref:hypothetical protein n=1 Tax=Rheinheimera sp. A13L TaxID=506534 RepID=UPI0002124AD1|nr:hypothetical protein [Rheinheimera sp. A13L]EGM76377.1 hypothetical protein Rhein_3439 [Rheinheimera sp. A13L]
MRAFLLVLFCVSSPLWACLHASHGIHGMVLLQVEDQFIASHLSFPAGKHAHQIVLQVSSELPEQVLQALTAKKLVTLEPQPFALHDLQQGKLKTFNAQVYLGHFERGGKDLGTVTVLVQQKLLDKAVGAVAEQGGLYRIALSQGELLVRAITGEGAVDEILYQAKGKDAEQLYFESADFAPQAK